MTKNTDLLRQMREHVAADPEADFLDRIAGSVLNAADTVERELGIQLTPEQYGYVVALLANSAVGHMATLMHARRKRSGE